MKTFEQLNPEQQEKARAYHLNRLLTAIVQQGLRFDDEANEDDLQARIDAAGAEAERMQTPWFWHEYIMDTCGDDLKGIAQSDAEQAVYGEADDPPVVWGIAS